MGGKYTSLRAKLPAFEEEATYQSKIDEAKRTLLGSDNDEVANVQRLASLFKQAKEAKDELEEHFYDVNVQLAALSQLLVAALQDQEIEKVGLASGATVFLQDTPYPSVKDKDALRNWIMKQEMQPLLSVNWQTLKGLCTERLANGEPCPPGVEVYIKTEARLRS